MTCPSYTSHQMHGWDHTQISHLSSAVVASKRKTNPSLTLETRQLPSTPMQVTARRKEFQGRKSGSIRCPGGEWLLGNPAPRGCRERTTEVLSTDLQRCEVQPRGTAE